MSGLITMYVRVDYHVCRSGRLGVSGLITMYVGFNRVVYVGVDLHIWVSGCLASLDTGLVSLGVYN